MEKVGELYSSLCIPSSANAYCIAIDFMKQWFLSKFDKGYWKSVYIDGKHVLDDFRQFNITDTLKKEKPSVAIQPQLVFEYDREKLDLYQGDMNQMIRRSRLESSFFKDSEKNMYVGLGIEQLQMNFTFRMKVSSRAQQVDLYKFLQLAFRIGSTQSHELDLDFHIPYSIILQLAKDAGFEVIDNKITNVLGFLSYMNLKSVIPVLFKYRTINGRSEFFLRFREMYTHISCTESLSADDGERQGMLSTNYIIDMTVTLKMPAPKMYMYYSVEPHDLIIGLDKSGENQIGFTSIKIANIPSVNNKSWELFLTTEYYEEDMSKPLVIEFKELFEDSDIMKVIDYNKVSQISSNIFIDFKIFNSGDELSYTIDWDNFTMTINNTVNSMVSNIAVYVDLNYVHSYITNLDEMNKDRLR